MVHPEDSRSLTHHIHRLQIAQYSQAAATVEVTPVSLSTLTPDSHKISLTPQCHSVPTHTADAVDVRTDSSSGAHLSIASAQDRRLHTCSLDAAPSVATSSSTRTQRSRTLKHRPPPLAAPTPTKRMRREKKNSPSREVIQLNLAAPRYAGDSAPATEHSRSTFHAAPTTSPTAHNLILLRRVDLILPEFTPSPIHLLQSHQPRRRRRR